MRFVARVEGTYGVHFVRIAPVGARFECNVRPRPAIGTVLTIDFEGLRILNDETLLDAFEAWRAGHAPTHELDRRGYWPTTLADLMVAKNWELWLELARSASADQLAAFALDRGGALLAAIRSELAGAAVPTIMSAQTRRFATVLGVPRAAEVLAELAQLHSIEHLMGLEHAVVLWMRATTEAPADELAALARALPAETVSAAVSTEWFQWWWRLARRCTRADLHALVAAALALAQQECRYATRHEVARAAIDEAARMAERMRVVTRAQMWAEPAQAIALAEVVRDEGDAHYAAYMAVTHAAHAIAAALRTDMDPGQANRHAMQLIANHAIELLR